MFNNHLRWESFYNAIKGADWPDCPLEDEFDLLPNWVKGELVRANYNINELTVKIFSVTGTDNIFYTQETDGGGTKFGLEYIDVIKQRYPNRVFDNCYEWCSGPGFIGYAILANRLCTNLLLTDIYYPAIQLAKKTANYPANNWKNNTSIYLLEDLSLLPQETMFDLIVANPPHFVADFPHYDANVNRICTDLNWNAHKHFFANIKSHLSADGIILLQENMEGSTIESFRPFIEDAGLVITDWFISDNWFNEGSPQIYYIEITHNENIS